MVEKLETDLKKRTLIAILKRKDILLRDYHPEIMNSWIFGESLRSLAQMYLPNDWIISESVARSAVWVYLDEVMDPVRKKEIALEHMKSANTRRRDYQKRENDFDFSDMNVGAYRVALGKNGVELYEGSVKFIDFGNNFFRTMNEKQFINYLREDLDFKWKDIEANVNSVFSHKNPRTLTSIKTAYQKWKKE
jgi:hypothetical protein